MNWIYIGKIVNTHGIKGEVRLLSNFSKKALVFKKDFKIYIGEEKEEEIINTYRPHKQFDMLTFQGINDINKVLKYKGKKVYYYTCCYINIRKNRIIYFIHIFYWYFVFAF